METFMLSGIVVHENKSAIKDTNNMLNQEIEVKVTLILRGRLQHYHSFVE